MRRTPLYRNIRSRGSLELFLLSGITSLLAIRFYLHLTGYPQVGGDTLHIAHMLWGGLLMLVSISLALTYLGAWSQRAAAVVGGAGFGVFIDEIGKFITRDNDYFYRPAVGIIYVIFVLLYLSFQYLTRERTLDSREYQLNALAQLEEAVASDLDPAERDAVLELLEKADGRSTVTKGLVRLVHSLEIVDARPPGPYRRIVQRLDGWYHRFWRQRESNTIVRTVFVVQAVFLLLGVLTVVFANVGDLIDGLRGNTSYSLTLLVGQAASASVAAVLALVGAALLPRSRRRAFEFFRRSVLTNLLLTQIFIFFREQFTAMPGFFLNLVLFVLVSYVLHQEHRLRSGKGR